MAPNTIELMPRGRRLGLINSHKASNSGFERSFKWTTGRQSTSFPGLQCEDEGRDEEALVWAGQFCILIG